MNIWLAFGIYAAGCAVGAGVMYAWRRREEMRRSSMAFMAGAKIVGEKQGIDDRALWRMVFGEKLDIGWTMEEDANGRLYVVDRKQ